MSFVDELLAQSSARRRELTQPTANPFAADLGPLGGFLESARSSIPELIGYDPSPGAVAFRSAHPFIGFASQVLPTMVPYAGMYGLTAKTAAGARALAKGMQGVKAVGGAIGMRTAERPIIAGAVKEMLRYSPLEFGRLGVGMTVNPENTGELFADVALSTAFAGGLGGLGAYLRLGGTGRTGLGGKIADQLNMFDHPVTNLRSLRHPRVQQLEGVTPEMIEREAQQTTATIMNDAPIRGYISKKDIPIITGIQNGDEKLAQHINAQITKPNSGLVRERALDRRKLWEGPADEATTLNAGELQPIVQQLGFQTPTDLAENVLQARLLTMNSPDATRAFNKMLESPGMLKYGDDLFAAKTNTGSTVLFKRLPRDVDEAMQQTDTIAAPMAKPAPVEEAVDEAALASFRRQMDDLAKEERFYNRTGNGEEAFRIRQRMEEIRVANPEMDAATEAARKAANMPKPTSRPTQPFKAGDRWAMVHTDRPGAFVRDLEKLNATNKQLYATMRRMYQPMTHDPHIFNQADNQLLRSVEPLDVARISRQDRKTWVAEMAKSMGRRGMKEVGLNNNATLQSYADYLYDIFAPSMFKERRNTLYARFSGLLQNRLRVVNEKVNEAIFGREGLKAGAKGVMGRSFERQRVEGQMAVREAVAQINDEELDLVTKALVTQTPAKEVAKLAADGKISEQAFNAVQRLQDINATFLNDVVLPATRSLGEKGNFDLLEGYVIPRILLGDWRVAVKTENGGLVYLASGKSVGAAERMAQAIVDEADTRGVKWVMDKANLKHAVEMKLDDITDIMEDMGRKLDRDPEAADIVQSAMKRVQFINVKREAKLPYRPHVPGTLVHKRTGIKATETSYTREEFIKAFESHIRKLGNFGAVHSFIERWGAETMLLQSQNKTLYEDLMRRAQQAMGIEGQMTRMLNNILTPVLGRQMGSKAATKIAAATNKTLYAWQLGFVNPTFALLNALSPIQTVLPQLAFVLRAPRPESNRLLHYVPLFGQNGQPIGQGAFLDPMRVMWEAVRQLRHADDELQHIHVRLRNDNTLHPMLFEEHVGAGAQNPQTLKESFQSGGWAKFLIDGSTIMARKSEEFARIVSANAGYLVGKNHLGLQDEQLYHFVRRFTESTNYLYGQSDRARLITGPVGSMFGLFKNWQMHFMGMMATYAGLGLKHNVWSPLVWQMATATTLGGLGSTPLRHLANGMANWATGGETKDGFLWMQENWGRPWADMAFFGPMGGLGISLQASSTIPGTDVRNDLQMLTSSVTLERGKQLVNVFGAAIDATRAGTANPLADPNIRAQLIAATMPRAISRAASVAEGQYINSMTTGYPQVQDVSFTGRMLHGMGMNIVELERHQVAARRLYKDQEARSEDITRHGRSYAAAVAAGDYEEGDRVLLSAMARGLELDSVMRSSSNFERREEGDLLARYKSQTSQRYRSAFGQ